MFRAVLHIKPFMANGWVVFHLGERESRRELLRFVVAPEHDHRRRVEAQWPYSPRGTVPPPEWRIEVEEFEGPPCPPWPWQRAAARAASTGA